LSSYWTTDNFEFYNDVILKINGAPGYGQNITMEITQIQKNQDFTPNGVVTQTPVTCTKGHHWDD